MVAHRSVAGRGFDVATGDVGLFLLCALPALLVNAFTILQPWVDPVELYRDPLLAADLKIRYLLQLGGGLPDGCCNYYWLGAVSNLGILVWSVTAGVLFAAVTVVAPRQGFRSARLRFLLTALLLTVLLSVDDLYQLHEQPHLVAGLKGEWLLYPSFALLVASYAGFAKRVETSGTFLLVLAIACFAMSLGADQLLPQRGATVLLEDSTKLFGTFFWFGYHLRLSVHSILDTFVEREPVTAC